MTTSSSEESLIDAQGSNGSQPESNSDLVRLDNENLVVSRIFDLTH